MLHNSMGRGKREETDWRMVSRWSATKIGWSRDIRTSPNWPVSPTFCQEVHSIQRVNVLENVYAALLLPGWLSCDDVKHEPANQSPCGPDEH